jgi:hypothetical protein
MSLKVATSCSFLVDSADYAGELAARPPMTTRAAAQHFEHGTMIWLEKSKMIYVLYSENNQHYDRFSDPWQEGTPEADPSIVPPDGWYQPVRGFGAVWRTGSVRQELGWAKAPESGLSSTFQCSSDIKYISCYMTTPNGTVKLQELQWKFYP